MIMPKFHIETQRQDGTWVTFTSEPFEDRESAEKHMGVILAEVGAGKDPSMIRVHEMTEDEIIHEHVRNIRAQLTKEEHEAIVSDYIKSLPPGVFWQKVAEAREKSEAKRQADKLA